MLSETELYDVLDAKLSYERLMRKLDDASNRIAVMRGIVLARSPAPAPEPEPAPLADTPAVAAARQALAAALKAADDPTPENCWGAQAAAERTAVLTYQRCRGVPYR